jgi:hypothetical protein
MCRKRNRESAKLKSQRRHGQVIVSTSKGIRHAYIRSRLRLEIEVLEEQSTR